MEMQAAIEGLASLKIPHHVYLVSDSAYLLNTLKHGWFDRWEAERVEHPDLPFRPNWDRWSKLVPLTRFHVVEYIKVKGHKSKAEGGDPYNERADKLAVEARKQGALLAGNLNASDEVEYRMGEKVDRF
jgi:ribonuclease HI